jgi:membrane protein DedA with SNARE-associated domain/rhodanese-related sulfurtransferase
LALSKRFYRTGSLARTGNGDVPMVQFLHHYGYSFIFLAVFAENLGLPLPSFPLIMAATALAGPLHLRLPVIFAVSTVAALISDGIWYSLGRSRGRPILRKLCSFSLSPDSCVNRTEEFFQRYGIKSFLVAKFVPGLNTIAPPLAGMLEVTPWRFITADLGGITVWACSAMALGSIFRSQVEWVLEWLAAFGRAGLLILTVTLAGWLLLKWVQRKQFMRMLERARITSPELKERLDRGETVVIVDLRSDLSYHADGVKIPGAIWIPPGEFARRYEEIPRGLPVAMYCTCPNEFTSAKMARLLMDKGYRQVWPMLGGIDAWLELGYPTEAVVVSAPKLTEITAAKSTA